MKVNYIFYLAGLIIGFMGGVCYSKFAEISKILKEMEESLKRWQ
jgi:hypothetical protein